MLREKFPELASTRLTILGIDINPAILAKARAGMYTAWSLRETPAHIKARFFRQQGGQFVLDPEIRSMVSFEEGNLLQEDAAFFRQGAFDVIFFRNVTIYFSQATTRRVIARLTRTLAPGGFLFLGHSETLRGISNDFHLRHSHDTFYYQLRDASDPRPSSLPPLAPIPDRPAAPAAIPEDNTWVQDIGRSADRIALLAHRKSSRPSTPAVDGSLQAEASPPRTSSWDFSPILTMLGQERFADALMLLGELPDMAKRDPDAQLMRAVVLANAGRLEEAERVCADLLEQDELNAGAHYVMALCREHDGDLAGAVQHDQTAIYLAPHFAMPHLHMGLLAKKSSDIETARRELGVAVGLLAREDLSRLLLFGGGFTREALTKLCEAELRACGGHR